MQQNFLKIPITSIVAITFAASCGVWSSDPRNANTEDPVRAGGSVRVDVLSGRTLIDSQTFIPGSQPNGADAIFILSAGSYDVTATAVDANGRPITTCTPAQATARPSSGTPARLAMPIRCTNQRTISAEVILSVEPPQTITELRASAPEVEAGQGAYFNVYTTGDRAAFTITWSVASSPSRADYHLAPLFDFASFQAATPGDYVIEVSVASPIATVNTRTPLHVRPRPGPPPPRGHAEKPCRDGDERLESFAARCDKAMNGVSVPAFDCDAPTATEVPRNTISGGTCGAPNVLDQQCDPGSRFQVLHRNDGGDGIYIVAHCRKKGSAAGKYDDVAVIQYNANSGATCFYQAYKNDLSHNAPAPITGDTSYWETPAGTEGINCVRCHDTGPFIRSEYLAQLGEVWPFFGDANNPHNPNAPNLPNADHNYLPGTLADDLGGPWNASMPYGFVGLNFQDWEAYSLSNSADSTCIGCHRMGVSRSLGSWNSGNGTAVDLGIRATDTSQSDKLPHGPIDPGVSSPIWMMPGQLTYDAGAAASAQSMADCGNAVMGSGSVSGCSATRLARGNTCPPPPVVVNGDTVADDPQSWVGGGKTPLGDPNGKLGFYFFTSIHGPFYQNSAWDPYVDEPEGVADPPWDPTVGAPSFRGTYLRIYVENQQWMAIWGLDATDIQNVSDMPPPPGGPGGKIEGVAYEQIDTVPDPENCGNSYRVIRDSTGTGSPVTATVDNPAGSSMAILAGLIGNVARTDGPVAGVPSPAVIRVRDSGGLTVLRQTHDNAASPALNQWFTGESWANGCGSWTVSPHYAVHGVESHDDVLLVPTADVANVICYIDGLSGDWSKWWSNGSGGSVQPYAQIYIDPSSGYRLKVWPGAQDHNAVSAFASCVYLK